MILITQSQASILCFSQIQKIAQRTLSLTISATQWNCNESLIPSLSRKSNKIRVEVLKVEEIFSSTSFWIFSDFGLKVKLWANRFDFSHRLFFKMHWFFLLNNHNRLTKGCERLVNKYGTLEWNARSFSKTGSLWNFQLLNSCTQSFSTSLIYLKYLDRSYR